MDTLALLCNLHADGPETLQRLRSAGWDTLREIEEVELAELEAALDADPDHARRFQREAVFLRRRLGGEPGLTDEPAPPPRASTTAPAPSRRSATPEPARIVELSGRRPPEDRDVRRPVAAARPESAPTDAAVEGTARPQPETEVSHTATAELELPAREVLIPRPSPGTAPVREVAETEAPEPSGLTPEALDGLDGETAALLSEAGIDSLSALGAAVTLELSRTTGLDYTSLLRLQFLARRSLAADAPPPAAPQGDDVAGPFA